jgi:Xaa-Pro aminopeptidase
MNQMLNRIQQIKEWILDHNLDAYIIPHDDEFLSEYLPPQNERLAWATGFNGSAGMAIICKDSAHIFVDGRYTVQVKQQVPNDYFSFHHIIEENPIQWLISNLKTESIIGYDARLHRIGWVKSAQKKLTLKPMNKNPIDNFWKDRPQPVAEKLILHPFEYSGENSYDKRQKVASQLVANNQDAVILTKLDSIAWLLNIRGKDIPFNPVALCSAILHKDSSVDIFIDKDKIPTDFDNHTGSLVRVHSPQYFEVGLANLKDKHVQIDPNSTNYWTHQKLENANAIISNNVDPCLILKACKNDVEIRGMKQCHIQDGIAMCKFLSWIDEQVVKGKTLTEATASDYLEKLRMERIGFHDLSFGSISGTGANGAIVHYSHTNSDTDIPLKHNSLYLIDSGGQYKNGTTDITRTIAIGTPTMEMKKMFTLVLKGHIALSSAVFPEGTKGGQLDILARQALWNEGFDYDHGTGHGVGSFLNVHEGPQGIATRAMGAVLQPGMVVSNEPGFYKEGEYGIRCENLIYVKKSSIDSARNMLEFGNLTQAPFDSRLMDIDLLTKMERDWINNYHSNVFEKISSHLSSDEVNWLKSACKEI